MALKSTVAVLDGFREYMLGGQARFVQLDHGEHRRNFVLLVFQSASVFAKWTAFRGPNLVDRHGHVG